MWQTTGMARRGGAALQALGAAIYYSGTAPLEAANASPMPSMTRNRHRQKRAAPLPLDPPTAKHRVTAYGHRHIASMRIPESERRNLSFTYVRRTFGFCVRAKTALENT